MSCCNRFEFPERPGALLKFLQAIGSRWNISLFHYRNHGSDYGRVLAGVQVPPAERPDFLQHLNELHYAYVEENQQPFVSDVPRRLSVSAGMSGSRGRLSAAAQPLAPDRQQHPENDRTDEQAHQPERPPVPRAPPNITTRNGICASRLMRNGRTMWSVQPITIPPQIRSPTPATVLPFNSSQATTQPQIVGAANGISPETVVSRRQKHRCPCAGDPSSPVPPARPAPGLPAPGRKPRP